MPNWCFNEWDLSGKPEAVEKAESELLDINDNVDFNQLVPMPELLRKTSRVYNAEGAKLYILDDENDQLSDSKRRPATPEELKELARVGDGYDDWYDWACAKWGTKWNGSSTKVIRSDYRSRDFASVYIEFNTAWGPPKGVIEAMAEKCKELGVQFSARSHGEDIWDTDYDSDDEES